LLDFLRFGTDVHSEELLEKAIEGISYYTNTIGVANVGGDLYKHECYNKNPLVNVGCIGLLKKENIIYGNATAEKQVLIYVGSKTGMDGLGGAVMASDSFQTNMDMTKMQHNVQKGDPFLEKLLLESCCEIAEGRFIIGMQDLGAGGLLCASQEMVKRGARKTKQKLGCKIFINQVPVKKEMVGYPCEIMISESQERMLLVADEENAPKIFEIFEKWDLECAVIGEVTLDETYSIYDQDILLYEKKLSENDITQDWPNCGSHWSSEALKMEKIKDKSLWQVYDSTVGNRTINGPDQDGSYAILHIREINKNIYLTWAESFEECFFKMKDLGAKPLCLVNCLNFGHPKSEMTHFVETIEELSRLCKMFDVPVVGGNVSLYNCTTGDDSEKSIRPTPILLMLGIESK